jgi:hypothetical protein
MKRFWPKIRNYIIFFHFRNRTNIIDFFIKNDFNQLPVWKLLIDMLNSNQDSDIHSSVSCLQKLTKSNKSAWRPILYAGGIEKLFSIIKKYSIFLTKNTKCNDNGEQEVKKNIHFLDHLALNTLSVLCNLSDNAEIKLCLSQITDLHNILIKILDLTQNEDIQSRTSILIGDVTSIDENMKVLFSQQNNLLKLLNLLGSDNEDLLVNTVNTIEIMCKNNRDNQNFCCENNVFESFKNLIYLNSGI